MRGKTQAGFTVVEISLFLAISGVMLLIAFLGVSVAIERARFQDTSRQVQSHIQSFYSDTLNGVSYRPDDTSCQPATATIGPGSEPYGSSNCILLGMVAFFPENGQQITTRYVVGSQPSDPLMLDKSTNEKLKAYQPVIVTNADQAQVFNLPWMSRIKSSCLAEDSMLDIASETNYVNCTSPDANAFMLLRSPDTGEIKQFAFYTGSASASLTKGNAVQVAGSTIGYMDFTPIDPNRTAERPFNICISDADNNKTSIIRAGGRYGASQASVSVAIDVPGEALTGACQ